MIRMYCLDSSVIVAIFRGDERVVKKLKKFESKGIELFVTPIVLCELYEGVFFSKNQVYHLRLVNDLILRVNTADFLNSACQLFGKYKKFLHDRGKPTQDFDLMTACITIANNLTLVTRNKKHFENIPNLRLEVW